MATTTTHVGKYLFYAVLLLVAAGFLSYDACTTLKWPKVDAVVLRGRVVVLHHLHSPPKSYQAEIDFSYSVDGDPYVSSARLSEDSTFESAVAAELNTTYAPGTHHTIRYDPDLPTAIRADWGEALNYLGLGVVFAFIGIFLAVRAVFAGRTTDSTTGI